MAENSKIEWTHHTFNPWRGCTKVSPGCANCYAESLSGRNPKTLGVWGPNGTRVVASEAMWREPVKWDRLAKAAGERHRVFCASLADVFEDWNGPMLDAAGVTLVSSPIFGNRPGDRLRMDDVRLRLFRLPTATPNLDWLFLTKRPENIARMMPDAKCPLCKGKGGWETGAYSGDCRCGNGLVIRPNVWLGVSVENQAAADERIPHLLKVPAAVRFLSMEPLLGPVDVRRWLPGHCETCGSPCKGHGYHLGGSDHFACGYEVGNGARHSPLTWVIVGGESGPNARPLHPDWVRLIRNQCQAAGVPFFFKQWGEWVGGEDFYSGSNDEYGPSGIYAQLENGTVVREMAVPTWSWKNWNDGTEDGNTVNDPVSVRVGKRAAGRLLDGREWSEIP